MDDQIYDFGHIFVTQWLDAVWLLLAPVVVHKGQRWKALAFVVLCMTVLRLQVGIVDSFGFDKGITGWLGWPAMDRGFAVYGIFTALYLVLSWFSPMTRGAIYLAASLSIFFMAFAVSSIVLII